jgi:hypothetical protein
MAQCGPRCRDLDDVTAQLRRVAMPRELEQDVLQDFADA